LAGFRGFKRREFLGRESFGNADENPMSQKWPLDEILPRT
jgi:hypothetical protein